MPFCCIKLHLKKCEPLCSFSHLTPPSPMATGHNAIMLNNFAYLISWRSRFVPNSVLFPITACASHVVWRTGTLFRDAIPAAQGTYSPRL